MAEMVEVVVEAANERGIKWDGAWHNASKYAKPEDVKLPVSTGARVRVELDGGGFLRKVETLARGNGHEPEPQRAGSGMLRAEITRSVCLKAAAHYLANDAEATTADLFALAEEMEQWIYR